MPETETQETENAEPEPGLHQLFIDAGKKKNPPGQAVGEAAIGAVLKDPEGKAVLGTKSEQIEPVPDPHAAEYHALIRGLRLARSHKITYVAVFSDSRTLVNQVNGIWKRNTEDLDALCTEALALLKDFKGTQVSWVPRKWNTEAHKEADKAFKALRDGQAGRPEA